MTFEHEAGLASPPPGGATPHARGLGRSRRQFELYTRFSVDFLVVMFGLVLLTDIWVGPKPWGVGHALVTALVLALVGVTVAMVHLLPYGRSPRRSWLAAVVVTTVLVMGWLILGYDPNTLYSRGAGSYFGSLAALVIAFTGPSLFIHWKRLLPAAAAATVACTAAFAAIGLPAQGLLVVGLYSVFVIGLGIATGALTYWMLDIMAQLDEARGAAARLAVAEERLRFSRDLHDVYGRTLSAIAMKSELAAELSARGDERAVGEMRAVRGLAQDSLAEVRSIVTGYREMSLEAELAGATSTLKSAGARFEVRGLDEAVTRLGPREQVALAWAVREGVTNVIRHSNARLVTLRAEHRAGTGHVAVTITNDGAQGRSSAGAPGTGLTGLAERLADVGGSVETDQAGGRFTLHVTLPAASDAVGAGGAGETGRPADAAREGER